MYKLERGEVPEDPKTSLRKYGKLYIVILCFCDMNGIGIRWAS